MCAGNRLGDVGNAVQSWVEENGFSVVREFVVMALAPKCMTSPTCRITVM